MPAADQDLVAETGLVLEDHDAADRSGFTEAREHTPDRLPPVAAWRNCPAARPTALRIPSRRRSASSVRLRSVMFRCRQRKPTMLPRSSKTGLAEFSMSMVRPSFVLLTISPSTTWPLRSVFQNAA